MKTKTTLAFCLLALLTTSQSRAQKQSPVKIVGAMKNVMMRGQLQGTIALDTIAQKTHLYGLGPMENLAGEILILDGKAYKATVQPDSSMRVEATFELKAPFFGYTTVTQWKEHALPAKIQTLAQLETYLDQQTKKATRPFLFKLAGEINQATIHVVNLPPGTKVNSPKEAHQGQVDYQLQNEQVEILGFFSTEHKTIFTHHDTFLHLHLITANRQKMGHLDNVQFKPGTIKLYLPVN
ncbi:acetolactate decarboxylase [Rufibacter sp. LB8]|uniref:acetolactate decarboxylase n=1 Tax=Rufibacter sp. LB8 TaxID=2777781 RepID=UPI001CEFAD53|nr:acetolactate decarboxylase [Rufibacter sp. LB8]